MNELEIILENFRIKEALINISNEIPLFLPTNCIYGDDIKKQQMRLKEMFERKKYKNCRLRRIK